MAKQRKRRLETREVYFIRVDGIEIGPFRSREAAIAEAKQIRSEGAKSVKLAKSSVSVDADLYPVQDEPELGDEDDLTDEEEEEWQRLLDGDDDDEEDDEIEIEDDDDEDEIEDDDEGGDDEEDEDKPPLVTHSWFRPLGGRK